MDTDVIACNALVHQTNKFASIPMRQVCLNLAAMDVIKGYIVEEFNNMPCPAGAIHAIRILQTCLNPFDEFLAFIGYDLQGHPPVGMVCMQKGSIGYVYRVKSAMQLLLEEMEERISEGSDPAMWRYLWQALSKLSLFTRCALEEWQQLKDSQPTSQPTPFDLEELPF